MNNDYLELVDSAKSFVRQQRIKAGYSAESCLYGYTFLELEERFEKIPCRVWSKILCEISSAKDLYGWYADFSLKFHRSKNREFHRQGSGDFR